MFFRKQHVPVRWTTAVRRLASTLFISFTFIALIAGSWPCHPATPHPLDSTQLAFDGQTLAEIVEQLNRYNQKKFVIVDPAVGRLRLGGRFDPRQIDKFASALARLGITVRETSTSSGDCVIALGKATFVRQ